ncbi:endonuclease III domain-containing protein [Aerococcus viridans]|uniref:endonuclease III domain-containing protein n=1 Tax=Aerococcus viridans TaxID=1377 RepID=UPI003B2106A2
MNKLAIRKLYDTLLNEMGPQGWWPADSKVEIILGAILVQNTNWRNVEKSLSHLKSATGFLPEEILKLQLEELETLIRPSGFYRNKARAIQASFQWFGNHKWDYQAVQYEYEKQLRSEILKLHGVGFETADVFRVFIFDQPAFIADAYARRLFSWLTDKSYATYQSLYQDIVLPDDFTYEEAQEFHGLIDEFGKLYLGKNGQVKENFLSKIKL